MNKIIPLTVASFLTVVASVNSYSDAPEVYLGAGYGQFKFEFDDDDNDTNFDDSQAAYRIFVGGNVTENFGGELTYINFDEANDLGTNTDIDGVSIAGVFTAPLGEFFSLYAKGGLFKWEASYSNSVAGIPFSESVDGNDIFYGVGAKVSLSQNVDLRFDYDRYELDDDINPELDIISANLQFNF